VAKVASHPTRIWLDHYPLASYLTATEAKIEQETIPVTTFADAGPRRLVGNYDHMGSHSGLFDAGSTSDLDPVLASLFSDTSDHYLLQTFGSASEGAIGLDRVIRFKGRAFKSAVGAASLLNFEEEGSGSMIRAAILRTATVTGTGDGTGQNLGATISGQQLLVTYRILAIAGGAITMQIHESQDNGAGDAYASIAALASGSLAAVGVTRVSTTGATEAWKRVTISAMTASSATILVSIGLVPNVA
jgi:hypothetical protein